jgi:probable phosphoglycerate mutase
VIADDGGKVLAELSEFLGHRTNNYAEYSGLLACLQWALDHGKRRLRVVSDSELMVKQIQGKYKVNSPDLRPLWEEARRRISQLERFEISHALRHKNKDADRLANEAMDRGTGRGGERTGAVPVAPRPASAAVPAKTPVMSVKDSAVSSGQMLRGFTRGGSVHLLGSATLPDGIFVKVIPE